VPIRTEALMGTLVTIHVVRDDADEAIERAFQRFREIEARCTRFDEGSELMQLSTRLREAVPVSAILFEAVQFALLVADDTRGALDPTVGARMEASGFDRDYRTGRRLSPAWPPPGPGGDAVFADGASYRDVEIDAARRTIRLLRPLTLDLGAVAKGLAVDAAARELEALRDFAIDAGGDRYLGGRNPDGAPWTVGIRHPRIDRELIESLRVSDTAVCTSGDYERVAPADTRLTHHILDPRSGSSPSLVASATVVAPSALLADALATAAFVLGPVEGLRLMQRHGVEGLIVTPGLERVETPGLPRVARHRAGNA
jgi:FAD:protein FMN transferase